MATMKLHPEAVLHRLLASSEIPALADLAGGVNKEMPDTSSGMGEEREARAQAAPRKLPLATDLAEAYRSYWTLAEREPLERFRMLYRHIIRLESATDPRVAWRTMREAATAFHTETKICPFCKESGPLHLPAERPEMELSGLVG